MLWMPHLDTTGRNLAGALADRLEADIRTGTLRPGEKLPPQRELADHLGVNLSTVTRAFKACELKGLIHGVVGRGTFVSLDARVSLSLAENTSGLIDMGQVLPLPALDYLVAQQVQGLLPELPLESLIRYPAPEGLPAHREAGARWLGTLGLQAEPEGTVITAGSQNALTCALLALFTPGDRIAVDALTYPGIKSLAALTGMRLVPVEADAQGLSAEALRQLCRSEPIKGIYLMPECHNPTTRAMSPGRREALAEVIRAFDLVLLEDDAYGYTGDPGSLPVSRLAPDHGIYLGGTAKLLGPGFRITYAAVPPRYRESFRRGLLNTAWMASPITAALTSALLNNGGAAQIQEARRAEAQALNLLAEKTLHPWAPQLRPCGFFQWLPLPPPWTGQQFELAAREKGVRIFSAEKFAVGGGSLKAAVRIALTGTENRAQLEKGLKVIRELLVQGPGEGAGLL